MNVLKMQIVKQHEVFIRYLYNLLRTQRHLPSYASFTTAVVDVDGFGTDFFQKNRENMTKNHFVVSKMSMQHFVKPENSTSNLSVLTDQELNKTLQQLILKNKDRQVEQILTECISIRRVFSDVTLKILLKHYSNAGKPELITILQKYCAKLLPNVYKRNGEFNHYLAKAQCFKGNSEKGLQILKDSYVRNENLRCFFRIIFKELIQDSVLNRSEATLVVFKKYVLDLSYVWEEHYPLVCFWHICWLSNWYSDQLLSNDLWDASEDLRKIVGEKVSAISLSALKADFNEDAVVRLLQTLLKYKMIVEYTKVLQVLFRYKLNNKDLRGCSEILRNCEVLGISLPSDQQGRYIAMLISGTAHRHRPAKEKSIDFKLKF